MPSFTVTKPSWFSPIQELRENDRVIGTLTMLQKLSYASVEAQMPDQIARFGYRGWNTRALYIQDPAGTDLATVKSTSWWNHNAVVTIDGKDYQWKQKNWWGTRCGWFGSDGREIMEFHMKWWNKMLINTPSSVDKTEMMLLFFGIYLLKLQEMEAASAGA